MRADGRTAAGHGLRPGLEESPDSRERWRRVTPARGDPRESATESRPPAGPGFDPGPRARVKGWGKSPPRRRQRRRHGKPRQEQGRIGTARGRPQGFSRPSGPGWLHEPVGDGGPRGMVVGDSGRHRIRLTGHPRTSPTWEIMDGGVIRAAFPGSKPARYNFSGILRRCCSEGRITRYCGMLAKAILRLVGSALL